MADYRRSVKLPEGGYKICLGQGGYRGRSEEIPEKFGMLKECLGPRALIATEEILCLNCANEKKQGILRRSDAVFPFQDAVRS